MQRVLDSRRILISLASIVCLFAATLSNLVLTNVASAASTSNASISIQGSFVSAPAGSRLMGHHQSSAQMTVTLVLRPNNAGQLNNLLQGLYDPGNAQFHNWLARGEFNQRFAPSASQIAQAIAFLKAAGLKVGVSPTPFLAQATGTTAQIEAAFHTTVDDYKAATGRSFYQNDTAVQIPASLGNVVMAVSGLSNTSQLHPHYITTRAAAQKSGRAVPRYGAGPNGSGLTPSQVASIYDAGSVYALGNRGKGKGTTLAVFELSGYTRSDITTYEQKFFGASENVPVIDVNVDGGPVTPACPTGDMCGPFIPGGPCATGCNSADYTGDIEVEADIEMQIALAPKADRILVYNAPNDTLNITGINEYYKIANDDLADSISSSWGLCEQDAGLPTIEAESVAFMQMAAQGQSMFSAAGDTGAFDCLRGSGNIALAVDDPSSQPFVTAVGGTSFEGFDPGTKQNPSYPTGFETVWNVLNACSATNLINGCANLGAGGGGVSRIWGRPPYQHGPGVTSSYSQKGPYCSQAAAGQQCRELPDVSANADEYTPYAEYCTGDPATNSTCATFSLGWFGIGGTSLSSPVWSAIIGLWDSVHGKRFGNANYGLYQLFRSANSYSKYFHDITGKNQTENNNGFYPTTENYDMATGIGTPRISGIARANF
ncbi:MAG: S8/S53 family peptidase [Ktedonobacteraceae bacterium]|nr:S8/S53 family peptidase [Ktedonobacteraceae bacterium]